MADAIVNKSNRMNSTRLAGKMVNDHWNRVFDAGNNRPLVWYEGSVVTAFYQAMGMEWAHGEAFSALLAARHMELPPQKEAERRGYNRELCSYARTHMGCALFTDRGYPADLPADSIAKDLPRPDIIVSAYPQCNTGLIWDDFSHRLFGIDKVPKFNIHIPFLTGAGCEGYSYMNGPQYEEAKAYLKKQLVHLTEFLAAYMGKPFDWAKFTEIMDYIKQSATLRQEGMNLSMEATPCPASFFDWSSVIAPISFCEAGPENVAVFQSMLDEVKQRIADGVGAVQNERYRLYWDGIANCHKLGGLSRKVAAFDCCMVSGRYTNIAFWANPDRINLDDPLDGYADNILACCSNHGYRPLMDVTAELVKRGKIDGMVLHSARTCRSMSNPLVMIQEAANRRFGVCTTSFEGDTVDESFYQDEILNTHLEALLEAIDARRANS